MKKGTRIWATILIFGLLGQLAWTIENMYFNVFVYNTLNCNVDVIAKMVSLSAITATVTTLVIGALSDKIGKREEFIVFGYFIWGLTVVLFAFLNTENLTKLFPTIASASIGGTLAIVMDCVMTFFGSSANDAAFNAWVTDNIDNSQRGKFETVLAALPLISMLIVFGLLDPLTQKGQWSLFFIIVGLLVSFGGIIGAIFIREQPKAKSHQSLFGNITYGFKKEVIKQNKTLYLSFICLLILSISTQIFMPYMIIYIQSYLGINNYALILGVVLIAASAISILAGGAIDKAGSNMFYVPSIIFLTAGLVIMYFVRKPIAIILSGIVFMGGNLIVTALINSSIRNHTPEGKAGQFQGIRMIFGVMLPMIIGPFIGAAVIKGSNLTYEEFGVVKNVPSPEIWLASAIAAILILLPYALLRKEEKIQKKEHNDLLTPYAKDLDINHPLPEYPRPQLVRDSYINLNGLWQYTINKSEQLPESYEGDIVVPFAIESQLSKVKKGLNKDEILWYRTTFTLPESFNKGLVYLHFGAVDQVCKVYINGQLVKEHVGGYLPFDVEISSYLEDNNELVVYVRDYGDSSYYSRGKQSSKRGGIWYTPISGIWQTVWLESTYEKHIQSIKYDVDYDNSQITLHINGNCDNYNLTILDGDDEIYHNSNYQPDEPIVINNIHNWSPEDPYLYDVILIGDSDIVKSYFGMRKFSIGKDHNGINRLMLNNKPYFHKGVLDQGYYSDGIYTPATNSAMLNDILLLKDMGFNTIRKHIKIEPLLWYYYCDKLGMLVWQDMVSGGTDYSFLVIAALPFINIQLKDNKYRLFARKQQESRDMFMHELDETVELLYNTVSLAMWVPFNEGWGQFDSLKVTEHLKKLDVSRTIDHASGWHDQKGGDLLSKHIYFSDIKFNKDERVWALTEYGGYSWMIKGHTYNNAAYGYKVFNNQFDLEAAFTMLHTAQIIPLIKEGLSATIYTQLSDVEDEVNGLITYDRKVIKFDKDVVKNINDKLIIK